MKEGMFVMWRHKLSLETNVYAIKAYNKMHVSFRVKVEHGY
jgi:hypothetical protein